MKKKIKEALIKYAIEEYNCLFETQYKIQSLSYEKLMQWIKEYDSSVITYWNYCCKGVFSNCWIDEYSKGAWGMTQEDVNRMIISSFKDKEERFNKEGRIACYKDGLDVHIVLIGRDLKEYKQDIFITLYLDKTEDERMIERQKEQKKGQILMAARIIQSENESIAGIPKVSCGDIAFWLQEDKQFVEKLIDICERLDSRTIAQKLNEENEVSGCEKFFWWNGLQIAWQSYMEYQLEHLTEEELDTALSEAFPDALEYDIIKELLMSRLSEFMQILLKEIEGITDEDLFTDDVVLEIAHMDISHDDFWWLYVKEVQEGKYIF